MNAWVAAHQTVIDEAPVAILMQAAKFAGDGAQTIEETLDDWTKKSVEQFEARGEVDHLVLGMAPDGSGIFFTKKGFKNQAEEDAFHKQVAALLDGHGLARLVKIDEVWTAPVADGVRPSKSDKRREAVVVAVFEGEQKISNVLYIERDWASGKATLLPPERVTGL